MRGGKEAERKSDQARAAAVSVAKVSSGMRKRAWGKGSGRVLRNKGRVALSNGMLIMWPFVVCSAANSCQNGCKVWRRVVISF